MKPGLICAVSVAALFAWAPAAAQHSDQLHGTSVAGPGEVFGGVGGAVVQYRFGQFTSGRFRQGGTVFGDQPLVRSDRDQVTTAGPIGHLGYVLPAGTLPDWLGRNVRVEFAGGYSSGHSSQSLGHPRTGRQIRWISVDGNQFRNRGANSRSTGALRTEMHGYDFALRLRTDLQPFGAVAPSVHVSPSVGVIGGTAETNWRYNRVVFGNNPANTRPGFEDHTIDSDRFGGTVGVDITWRAAPALDFIVGGNLAVMRLSVDHRANDCQNGNGAAGVATVCIGAGTNGFVGATSGSDTATNVRYGFNAGTRMRFHVVSITLMITAAYENNVPFVLSATQGTPARVGFEGQWSVGGYFNVSVPISFLIGG